MNDRRVTIGDKGGIVLSAAVRARRNWSVGTDLVVVDTEDGIELVELERLKARVRARLAGRDLVGELLAERRAEAAREDAEWSRWGLSSGIIWAAIAHPRARQRNRGPSRQGTEGGSMDPCQS